MVFSDSWISIINTFIALSGLGITFYIANTVNKKLDSERILKNHLMEEVKSLRLYEEEIFRYIIKNEHLRPRYLKSQLGVLDTRISDIMNLLNKQYGIQNSFLDDYQWKYSRIIIDDETFTSCFRDDIEFSFQPQLIKDYSNHRSNCMHLFNDLIVEINNAKRKR